MVQGHGDQTITDEEFYLKYTTKEILGDGISSVVRRCVHKESGKEYAVKIIDKFCKRGEYVKGIDVVTQFNAEVNALSKLKGHPNIITLKDCFESSAFMFLVIELAHGGELFDYLTREVTVTEKIARKLICQLFLAVKYIHDNGIVHRDIKPENILLNDKSNVILSDFGFATTVLEEEPLYDIVGTPSYFAPEVLKCLIYEDAPGYGRQVDLWSCGVVLYTLLVGQSPFWHRKDTVMYRNIMEGNYKFSSPEWDDISEGPKDLILKLLVVNPSQRYSADDALAHPWLEGTSGVKKDCAHRVRKLRFKTIVMTIMSLKNLYYTYHEKHAPMTYKEVFLDPYSFKEIRKTIDSFAFSVYGHWVKRTPDQIQNRGALFANSLKKELVTRDVPDGNDQHHVSLLYSHKLTQSFIPKRPSFLKS